VRRFELLADGRCTSDGDAVVSDDVRMQGGKAVEERGKDGEQHVSALPSLEPSHEEQPVR
jgi:hypothetical protein